MEKSKKWSKLLSNNFNTISSVFLLIIALFALGLVYNQLQYQKKENNSNLIGDYLILEKLFFEIQQLRNIPENSIFFENAYKEQTIQYLKDLKDIVNQGVNNDLLKMNSKIYSQWWVFYGQIDFTINMLNDEILLTKYYNIPVNREFILNGLPVDKKDFDMKTLEDFKNYFKTFWIKGVENLFTIKEIKNYSEMYFDLSNYGRIIRE